jgi:peptidoglycan/LPS O-acetylase OafA/YrhL
VRICAFCGLTVVATCFPIQHFLFGYLFLFMFGMAAFQLRAGLLSASQFVASMALLAIGAWHVNGPVITIAGVAAAATIGFIELGVYRPLVFFGHISYSLYLLHLPIGGRVINLGARFAHTTLTQLAILTVALAASIAASWLLYEYVERPSQRWSSAIRYGRTRVRSSSNVSIMPVSVESLS